MDEHIKKYREEADELLLELETALLELEENPDDFELVGRVFRAMHTIKGSGSMFGFNEIADFIHHVETVLDNVRNGFIPVTKELINLTLSACDHIKDIFTAIDGGPPVDENKTNRIISDCRILISADLQKSPDAPKKKDIFTSYYIKFLPNPDIFLTGLDPVFILDELRETGQADIIANTKDIPLLENIDPEKCYFSYDIIITTNQGLEIIQNVFIFVEDDSEIKIEKIIDKVENIEKTHDIIKNLIKEEHLTKEYIDKAFESYKTESPQKTVKIDKKNEKKEDSIRVPAQSVDKLINLVGELVITQARLSQIAGTMNIHELLKPVEKIEKLTEELRDNVQTIRMLPIGTTFSRFKRLVHDLSFELNKKVVLVTHGGETKLDKSVLERLNDPIVHLIRNAMDHGVESPETRKASDKPLSAIIHLSAAHVGANVLITIEDDGAGIDSESLRTIGIQKGIIKKSDLLSESELLKLIFIPGFSTSNKVTNISGRGVGLDVVNREIKSISGASINISSQKGRGTIFTLSLPLTLAIIAGFLIKVNGTPYIIPLTLVDECLAINKKDKDRRDVILIRNELIPYIHLSEFIGITHHNSSLIEHLVIVKVNNNRVGILVDEVIGDLQVVIKSLGRIYKNAKGISGATILGDGSVALIVDVPQLIDIVKYRE